MLTLPPKRRPEVLGYWPTRTNYRKIITKNSSFYENLKYLGQMKIASITRHLLSKINDFKCFYIYVDFFNDLFISKVIMKIEQQSIIQFSR